jgi:hypothetical protein
MKKMVAEVESYGFKVDVKGTLHPFRTLDIEDIKIYQPATAKATPEHPKRLVDSVDSCLFAYYCLQTELNELGLCNVHYSKLQALIMDNPKLSNIFPSIRSVDTMA